MLQLSIDIQGGKELNVRFLDMEKRLSNFSEPLIKANALIRRAIDVNFDTSGRELGAPWKPLAQSTIKQKGNSQILVRTGKMRSSFSSIITPMSATIRNVTSYFRFHQSAEARNRLPRRVMMRIDQKRRDEIIRLFTEYLHKVAKRV